MTKINLEEVECKDCGHKREVARCLSRNSWTASEPDLPSPSDYTDEELAEKGLSRQEWNDRCEEYEQNHLESVKYWEERRMSDTCVECGSKNLNFFTIGFQKYPF